MRRLLSVSVALALTAAPASAWAQAGWYATPSLSLVEEYDDNVFGLSSGRESDFITRTTLGLIAGYRSVPLTLLGSYSVGAEVYAEHSDLNGAANRQQGGLELGWLPNPLLAFRLSGSYARNETSTVTLLQPAGGTAADTQAGQPDAGAVTPPPSAPEAGAAAPGTTTVEVGRRRTTIWAVSPSIAYTAAPGVSTELRYDYSRTKVEARADAADAATDTTGPEALIDTAHEARFRLAYQLTALTQATLGYRFRRFESDGADSTTSHVGTLGLSRPLFGERTRVTLEAGPRYSEGDWDVEANARLEHRFQLVTVSLGYARSEGIVTGRSGAQTTDTGSLTLSYQPWRELVMTLGGSVLHAEGERETDARDLTAYRAGLGLAYRLAEWAVARIAYSFAWQEEGSETIRHHVVSVGLDLLYPMRVY